MNDQQTQWIDRSIDRYNRRTRLPERCPSHAAVTFAPTTKQEPFETQSTFTFPYEKNETKRNEQTPTILVYVCCFCSFDQLCASARLVCALDWNAAVLFVDQSHWFPLVTVNDPPSYPTQFDISKDRGVD